MGSRLPSVGEASRSIRHGQVSVKDTYAFLARAALSRDTGGEPQRLGGGWRGQRQPCLGQHACDTGEDADPGAPQAVDMGMPSATRPWRPASWAGGATRHDGSWPILGPRRVVWVRRHTRHQRRGSSYDAGQSMTWRTQPRSPAQLWVVVHCLGGSHRERRRGALSGRAACGCLTTTHRQRGVL
jgi:hypothetical protein